MLLCLPPEDRPKVFRIPPLQIWNYLDTQHPTALTDVETLGWETVCGQLFPRRVYPFPREQDKKTSALEVILPAEPLWQEPITTSPDGA